MQFKPYWKQGFISGMDQSTSPSLVNNNESPYLLNIVLDQTGTWSTRRGTTAIGTRISASDEGWGIFTYDNMSGTHTLFAITDRDLFKLTEPATWATADTDEWPANTRVDAVNYNNRLYIGSQDGATALKYTTGSTVTSVTPTIGGSQLATIKNTLVVQGNNLKPNIAFFSNPYTDTFYASTGTCSANADSNGANTVVTTTSIFEPDDIGAILYNATEGVMAIVTNWTSATVPYLTTDISTASWDNDTVYVLRNRFQLDYAAQGIVAFQENAISFDEQNMYMWDPTTPNWSRTISNTGCVNYRTIAVVDNLLLFMGRGAIYLFTGSANPEPIEGKIRNKVTLNGIWDLINWSLTSTFCAGVKQGEGKYFLYIGTLQTKSGAAASAVANAVLAFDIKKGAWVLRSYPEPIYAFANFINSSGVKDLYAVTSTGLVIKMDSGDTDALADTSTAAISFVADTSHYILGDPRLMHYCETYTVRYSADNNVTLTESIDRATPATLATLPASATVTEQAVLPRANRSAISHSLRFSGTADFTLEGIGFESANETTLRIVNN